MQGRRHAGRKTSTASRLSADRPRPARDPVQRLQRALGNRALTRFVEGPHEREADRVGDRSARDARPERAVGRAFESNVEQVPVEASPAITSALDGYGARAATDGQSVFVDDRLAGAERRAVVAHELVHVAQQASGRAPAGVAQLKAKPGKNGFRFGEVTFPQAALQKMVMGKPLLFGTADRKHIDFENDALGYDPKYTTAEDPFRYDLTKHIVEDGKAIVRNVSKSKDIEHLVGTKKVGVPLVIMGGHGLFLPPANSTSQGDVPKLRSTDPDTAHVWVEDGHDQSLAHELLGHFELFLRGGPFEHPESSTMNQPGPRKRGLLTAKHKVATPTGEVFIGSVNDYLRGFVDNRGNDSPSRLVGTLPLQNAVDTFIHMTKKTTNAELDKAWDTFERIFVNLADVKHGGRKADVHKEFGRAAAAILSSPMNRGFEKRLLAFLKARAKGKKNERLAVAIMGRP